MDSNFDSNSLNALENCENPEPNREEGYGRDIAECEVNKEYLLDEIKIPGNTLNELSDTPREFTPENFLDFGHLKEKGEVSELQIQLDDAVNKLQIRENANPTSHSIAKNKLNLIMPNEVEETNGSEPDHGHIPSECFAKGDFNKDNENENCIDLNRNVSGSVSGKMSVDEVQKWNKENSNAENGASGIETPEKDILTSQEYDPSILKEEKSDFVFKGNSTKLFTKLEPDTKIENQHSMSKLQSNNISKTVELPKLSEDETFENHFSKNNELNRVQAKLPPNEGGSHYSSKENNVVLSKDDNDDNLDTICGIGGFNPKWLQSWATPRVFLTLYSLLGVISGMYYTYRVGALTTLEKRFSFNSQMSGTIMMVDEVTPVFLGAIIGYFGGKTHRPRMFGIGMLLSTFCCFVSALPYFIYGPSSHLNIQNVQNKSGIEICEDEIRKENCNADDRPPTVAAVFFLMLAGFFKGFGNLAYYSIGLSYMDDISKKKNTAIYFAVVFSLRLVGPVFGYLMSSFFLKFYENPFDDPGYGPDDPRWIGAWWIGFVLQGVLQLLLTIPLALFPRRLPGQKRLPSNSEIKGKLESGFKGLLAALKRLAMNPLYLSIVVNTIMNIFGSVGHFMMLPKYMEQQFKLTASDASLYSGPPGIIAVMVSTLLGGYLIWKFKPSARFQIAAMIVLEAISAVGYFLLIIPQCDKVDMSHFGLEKHGLILEGQCNVNCNCTTKIFTPICGSDGKSAYFSPCFAGCTENLNKSFSDCSCILDSDDQQTKSYAKEGFCFSEGCWGQALGYIISLPILQFIASLLRVQYTVILLRSMNPEDKSVALGMFEALICIFGFVPYLILFGALVDTSCLIWEKSCGKTGNCWFYDIDKFNHILHGVSGGFSIMAALSLVATYYLSNRLKDLYDDENEICNVANSNEEGAKKNDLELNSASKL